MWGAVTRSDDVRKGNRRRILAAIRRRGLISRTDIGQQTGLSAATVSAITFDLISEGVLVRHSRDDASIAGRGRPKVDLSVNPAAGLVGTMNLQLNSVTATIIDYTGTPLAESAIDFDSRQASAASIRRALMHCLQHAFAKSGQSSSELKRIAVGVQGVTDVGGMKLLWSPVVKQRNLPIRSWLESEFGVPVSVCNDCDLMALALNWNDPQRYSGNFAAILFAHGVGMGLFLRGGLINGTRTSGIEFGHMIHIPGGAQCRCGSRGCIEAYAGDYAVKRRASGLPDDLPPPGLVTAGEMAAIVEAAQRGDDNARAAIEAAGRAIGTGLASIFALVDPFPVALIGSGTVTRDLLEPAIRAAIAQSIAVKGAGQPVGGRLGRIRIDYFADGYPLVQKGSMLRALLAADDELANAGP